MKRFVVFILLAVPIVSVFADTNARTDALVARLNELLGQNNEAQRELAIEEYASGLAQVLLRQKSNLPPEALGAIRDEISKLAFESMHEADAMGYLDHITFDRYYTEKELEGLVTFYESPLGRRHVAQIQQMQMDTLAASNEFINLLNTLVADKLAPRLNERLEKEGW